MKLKPELRISLQCNPVNTATNRPKKIGRINVVTVLTRVFIQENVPGGFCQAAKKSGRSNEVAVTNHNIRIS